MGIKETSGQIFEVCRNRLVYFGHLVWKGDSEEAKKPVTHLFHFPVQIVATAFLLYWQWKLPLPNKAVLCLAAIAALMVLVEMRPIHKAIYILLILALVMTENRAINDDRAKFERDEACRRQEENAQFREIANDLKSAIKLSQDQFAATMRQFGENVNTITGGNSFAIVWAPLIPINATNTFPLILQVRGHYDLQDVRMEVVKLPEPGFGTAEWAKRSLSGTNTNVKTANLGNVGHRSGMTVPISVTASDDGGITEYSVNVYARNRMTHESLRIKKNLENNRWESSLRVIDGDTYQTLEQSKPEWRPFTLLPQK